MSGYSGYFRSHLYSKVLFILEGSCPPEYPWVYYNGHHCCKTRMEKVAAQHGRQCDGGQIEYDSLCCHDDDHAPNGCSNPPCQNYIPGKFH